jgi:hypothetical protein
MGAALLNDGGRPGEGWIATAHNTIIKPLKFSQKLLPRWINLRRVGGYQLA